MNYLLDSHAVIWYFEDSQKLPQKMIEIIDDSKMSVYISSTSLWEIAIKMNLGKLDVEFSFDELLAGIEATDFDILQVENEYLQQLSTLPPIHKDPFDRLLIASAIAEDLTIITTDENIQRYGVKWIW